MNDLPEDVRRLIHSAVTAEVGTTSSAGVPIDTPLLLFPDEGAGTLSVATGLAYPAKAERARRNPKVGMLIEGREDEPVISIAGFAAVRDSDIEANAIRYISEVGGYGTSLTQPWEIARQAVWYWSRIIIEIKPKRILWWKDRAAMNAPPEQWHAPADTEFPASDPPPAGKGSAAPSWPVIPWREYAQSFLDRGVRGYLTLLDSEGFALPIGANATRLADNVLELEMPEACPWAGPGIGTFTFEGRATFVGQVTGSGPSTRFEIERMLPALPIVADPAQVLVPNPENREALMNRLHIELARRGQMMPNIPMEKPADTPGSLRRQARIAKLRAEAAGRPKAKPAD